jgi:hypothetical protein
MSSSLAQPPSINALAHGYEFSESFIQFRAEHLEARFMPRGLLWSPNASIRRTLEEVHQLVYISVQKIELRTQVSLHRWHSLIGVSAFHGSRLFLTISFSRPTVVAARTASSVREREIGPIYGGD